jgi:hypothetical protein
MRPLAPVAAAIFCVVVATGCAGSAAAPARTTAATAPSSRPAATAKPSAPVSTAEPAPDRSDPGTLTMAFAGDVHFEEYLAPLARDPHALDELRSSLGAADLAMVNLETAITERGTKIGKEFHFRSPSSALDTIKSAGIDAVSMANNHGVDYGPVGLQDTLAAKRTSPIPVVGIGADRAEALAPAVLHAKGLDVAVFGASQVYEMTLLRFSAGQGRAGIASSSPVAPLAAAVSRAAKKYDVVVVFLHWGQDYQQCPDGQSTSTARALEDAGADIIVGGHSHRVNGAGWLGRSYVDYGLGNFVWWRHREPDSRSGVLTLSIDVDAARDTRRSRASAVRSAAWTPMLIGADGIPRPPAAPADSTRLLKLWDHSRGCTGLRGSA